MTDSLYWVDIPGGQAKVFVREVAPHIDPRVGNQVWFIYNLQPDGMCMNCRQRPGDLYPWDYYACSECVKSAEKALYDMWLRQKGARLPS